MFKFIVIFLIIQQVISTDDQVTAIPKHPLFTKILELIDQLLLQVRTVQTLLTRTRDMFNQIPTGLRPFFDECFTATHNVTQNQYSSGLNEAETTRIPQIQTQLRQATTLEQQLNGTQVAERMIADISFNIIKPSLTFITKIHDCFKSKLPMSTA